MGGGGGGDGGGVQKIKKKRKKREKRKAFNISEVWPLVSPCRGLVDVDSVDELCEELLHLPGTQIQCGTSDTKRKRDLDVMAVCETHGQTLYIFSTLKSPTIVYL